MSEYKKKGAITKKHLDEAIEYIFRNRAEPKKERQVKLKIFFADIEEAQKWYENTLYPIFQAQLNKEIEKLEVKIKIQEIIGNLKRRIA